MVTPNDPTQAIQRVAQSVDRLAGMVGALIAYVAALPGAADVGDLMPIKGHAQQIAGGPPRVSTPPADPPGLVAGRTVDAIAQQAKSLKAVRSQG